MEFVLERPVLVLNRLWQPVHTCSVKRALKLLCLGHAQVVQTEGECRYQTHDIGSWVEYSGGQKESVAAELVHSVKVALRVPKIIVLALYDRVPRKEVKFTRQNVFLRDKYTCQYCAEIFPEIDLNLDHVMPRDKGGKTTWDNIVTSCIPVTHGKLIAYPVRLECNFSTNRALRNGDRFSAFGSRRASRFGKNSSRRTGRM